MALSSTLEMRGVAKTIVYGGLILCGALLLFGFAAEFKHVLNGSVEASKSRMMAEFAGFLGIVVLFAVLCAYDLSRSFGHRAEQWILQGGPPILPAPELELAERIRAGGEPLGAIRVLRDYLKKNPSDSHVMARIAEIYKQDLKNDLAAALEYEELLKHKLAPEQWGWAALGLTKLYGRLRQPEKALALLRKIDAEYGKTLAGRRARKRLIMLEAMNASGQENELPNDAD